MLGADQHGISPVERMRNRQNQITNTVRITFSTKIAPIKVGTEETGYYNVEPIFFSVIRCKQCQKYDHSIRKCKCKMPRCGRCAGTNYTEECTVWYRTECTNCHSIEHGVVYDGCPVAVEFDRQTNQRNNLLKQQYRQQLNEQQTRENEIIKTQRKP